jgi:Lar family restriction alleviation protein
MADLLPCPFCGHKAEFEREGTARHSCIVACTSCGARHESGDTWNSGASWNRRVPALNVEVVRRKHPKAFALPPGALSGRWTIIPHANSSPLPRPIAEGDSEAAAWEAAAKVVAP